MIYFRTFWLVPWEFKIADVHVFVFLKKIRTAFSQKTSWLNLLNLNLKKMQQSKEITTKNQKVVSFISSAIHFIFSPRYQLKSYHMRIIQVNFFHYYYVYLDHWKLDWKLLLLLRMTQFEENNRQRCLISDLTYCSQFLKRF